MAETASHPVEVQSDPDEDTEQIVVSFNGRQFSSYADAVVACRTVGGKGQSNPQSNWYRSDLVVDEPTRVFLLRWATCKTQYIHLSPSNICTHTRGSVLR